MLQIFTMSAKYLARFLNVQLYENKNISPKIVGIIAEKEISWFLLVNIQDIIQTNENVVYSNEGGKNGNYIKSRK